MISRLDLQDGRMIHEERLFDGDIDFRIRDIEQGPDGMLYILTDEDNGRLVKLTPAD